MKTYKINSILYTIQGEGSRAGTPTIFVRFSGCNLKCTKEPSSLSPGGFDCDTEFESGRHYTAEEIIETARRLNADCQEIFLTGGEPLLQVDSDLLAALHAARYFISAETNGTRKPPDGIDWLTCCPKVAEHAIRLTKCDDLKYVRTVGQEIPRPATPAKNHFISPAFDGTKLDADCLRWCVQLVTRHPKWRLSIQQHKLMGIQ